MNDVQPPLPPSVLPGPSLPAAPPAHLHDIDTGLIIRDTLRANGELVQGLLRTIAPTLDAPVDAGQVVGTYSTPAESAQRTSRFKFSIVAIVLICATISAGVVLLAYVSGAANGLQSVAFWLALTGMLSAGFVTWLQTVDMHHSAEGIAHAREGYRAVVEQQDAASRADLAKAYAYAIRRHADAQADSQAARTQLTLAEVQRQAAPAPAPRRPALVAWQPATYAGAEDDGPIYAPQGTDFDCAQSSISPHQSPAAQIDPLLAAVLAFVANLYADGADANGLIQRRLPWSQRGEMSATQRDQVLAMLDRIQPPLIETRAGNRAYLNRRDYPSKFSALGAINHVWD